MKTLTTLRLGSLNTDTATGLSGMLTHWQYEIDGKIRYLLQPKKLNPDTGKPVDKIFLEQSRLKKQDDTEQVEVPDEILGSQVTDNGSGFTGTAIAFVRHVTGCFHVVIQPQGVVKRTNEPFDRADFALVSCSGPKIPKLKPAQVSDENRNRPSPSKAHFPAW